MARKSVSLSTAINVSSLPTPVVALTGATVNYQGIPYWCNGVAWIQLTTSSVLGDLAAVQARRTTTYTLTTVATDIALDTVDVANTPSLVYRDATNTSRIYVTQAGLYSLSVDAAIIDSVSGTTTSSLRFSKNGSTTAIPGSIATINPRNTTARIEIDVVNCLVVLAAGDYVTLQGLKSASAGNGIVQIDCTVKVVKMQGATGQVGPAGGASNVRYAASDFDNPNSTDWAVNALAPALADPSHNALTVRAFDDTTEEGVGLMVAVPPTATTLAITMKVRAATTPATAKAMLFKLYGRLLATEAPIGAWLNAVLNTVSTADANFRYFSQTFTLASLGYVAGNTYQLEVTRVGSDAADTLVGDAYLFELGVAFG